MSKFSLPLHTTPQGLVVNWGATYKEEGILSNYQGVIFNQDGLSYDQKYDLIEEEEKVEDYRKNLKIVKDATRVSELEKKCIFADENSSAAQYHEGLKSENDDSGRYRYINDINYQAEAACSYAVSGYSTYIDDALGFMTEEQIRNYNYLYYNDSINGTDYADEYIDLLIPSLRQKAAAAQYEGIKDSTALKAVYEVGIGFDSISTGIENVFGLNDDRDGVAMNTTSEYLDGMIMSSAKTKGEMYLYTGSKVVGAAAPGVGIAVATGGAGAVGLLAGAVGTGALYGVSTGGNSKAQAEREGYTESQAVAYGTATGIEQGVKTSAMFVVGGAGRFATGIPAPVGALGAGVTGFTMEYVDEVYINPAIRANILNDEAAYDIDYKQALINAGIAGAFTAGTYYIESVAASRSTAEVVANENVEVTAVESHEVVLEDVASEGLARVESVNDIVPNKGFNNFNELKAELGSPGEGNAWHHIVEQSQISKSGFDSTQVNNINNVISIPHGKGSVHAKISGYYSSKQFFTGGQTVRQWLSGQSFQEQFEFGINLLREFGTVTPTSNGWIFTPY